MNILKCTKKAGIAALAAAMALNLAACGEGEANSAGTSVSGAEASASGGTHLNFACYNYSNSLDPVTNPNSAWCGTRYGVTECLFRFN